jgi:nicotinamide riboside transporter PnuC
VSSTTREPRTARDTPELPAEPDAPVSQLPLWFALLGGPIAWTAHLLLSYPLVPVVCATGGELLLHAITLVTAVVSLAAAIVGWWSWRKARAAQPGATQDRLVRRTNFMGRAGALTSGLFFLVIIAEGLPVLLQNPCDWTS